MKQHKNIAIIGGTGKTGSYLVAELLKQGYKVKMLVRNPEKLQVYDPAPEIVQGNARDYASVSMLLKDCDAVISTLGHTKGEEPIFSKAAGHIIKAMSEYGIRRYIVVAGLGVDAPDDRKDFRTRIQTRFIHRFFPKIAADHQKEFDMLMNSNIDWTMIRLPFVKLIPASGELKINTLTCPGKHVSAESLAQFMAAQITDRNYIRKAPYISN